MDHAETAHPSTSLDLSKQTSSLAPGLDLRPEFRPNPEYAAPSARLEETVFRHSSWAALRLKTWEALNRSGTSVANLDRFAECGAQLWAQWNPSTKEARLTCNKCKSRWCVACGNDRAALLAANLRDVMHGKRCRFVTLTRRHSHATLADQIDALYEAFGKLRRREWWKTHVTGGAAFLEVKWSEVTGLWHPHLHLIVEGKFLPQQELSREWLAVTIDSSIVDVRDIPQAKDVARYVTKYVTKPASHTVTMDPDRFIEAIVSLKGRRLCLTFGTWRGIKLEDHDPPETGWEPIGTLRELVRLYHEGNRSASECLHALAAKYPRLATVLPLITYVPL